MTHSTRVEGHIQISRDYDSMASVSFIGLWYVVYHLLCLQ